VSFAPGDLILEIPQGAVVDAEPVIARMTALRTHGLRFALDDAGAGHSSLRLLTRLPIDGVKLDQCFVAALDGTANGSAVAEAVIRLGTALHLDTVAEGVENQAQATELPLLGCHTGQGHYFAYPMSPDDVAAVLAAGQLLLRPV
jgi:EAL domain-containing protein (putative c-di-GMP-specific phosphodiesterase class I)